MRFGRSCWPYRGGTIIPTYSKKDFERLAAAIGKHVADVMRHEKIFEAAAMWYRLYCEARIGERITPFRMRKRMGTAVLAFLMVFVLQHSQNRDAVAIQAKLDELILHTKDARNDLIEAEKLTEKELQILRESRTGANPILVTGRVPAVSIGRRVMTATPVRRAYT